MLSCRGESVLWLFVNNGERWCWSHNRVLPRTVGRGGSIFLSSFSVCHRGHRLYPGQRQWERGGYRPYTRLDTAEAGGGGGG